MFKKRSTINCHLCVLNRACLVTHKPDFPCIILSLSDGTDGLNRLVRSESRRRLPDPPSGVEPVTLQSQFHSANESVQLEQRMQGKT